MTKEEILRELKKTDEEAELDLLRRKLEAVSNNINLLFNKMKGLKHDNK